VAFHRSPDAHDRYPPFPHAQFYPGRRPARPVSKLSQYVFGQWCKTGADRESLPRNAIWLEGLRGLVWRQATFNVCYWDGRCGSLRRVTLPTSRSPCLAPVRPSSLFAPPGLILFFFLLGLRKLVLVPLLLRIRPLNKFFPTDRMITACFGRSLTHQFHCFDAQTVYIETQRENGRNTEHRTQNTSDSSFTSRDQRKQGRDKRQDKKCAIKRKYHLTRLRPLYVVRRISDHVIRRVGV
jgi:hypothetical protein